MKKIKWISISLVILGLILSLSLRHISSAQPSIDNETSSIRYDVVERSQHTIHTITIPYNSDYAITPAISGELQLLPKFIQDTGAIASINGGYFDPVNGKTTSFIAQDFRNIADPRFNERLVDNPDLKQYLSKIFNRAEFRRYSCGTEIKYDIQLHSAPVPTDCKIESSLGGGPGLLPEDTSIKEAFTAYKDGTQIRDAIGAENLNARSAIAITQRGDIIFVMVAQKPEKFLISGISLPELTDFLASLGAVKAMNLDGGSSASLHYDGQTIYGKVDKDGKKIERPVKSVLLVTKKY